MHSLTRLTLLSVGQRNCGLVKSFELLIEMTKHSRFEFFYSSTPVEVRESSAKALVVKQELLRLALLRVATEG